MEHLIINCATGEHQRVPLTVEEIAEKEAEAIRFQAEEDARKQRIQQRAAAIEALRNHSDPVLAALAEHL